MPWHRRDNRFYFKVRSFLENHARQLVSIDFLTVPTIRFQVLYVFLVLAHDRRRIVHFNVTARPTAGWTGQQLREAFPFDQLPRYLLRDRDAIFGDEFRGQVRDLGTPEVLSTPRSPIENPSLFGKDSPAPRPIQPPEMGPVIAGPQAGGLHPRYQRRAA